MTEPSDLFNNSLPYLKTFFRLRDEFYQQKENDVDELLKMKRAERALAWGAPTGFAIGGVLARLTTIAATRVLFARAPPMIIGGTTTLLGAIMGTSAGVSVSAGKALEPFLVDGKLSHRAREILSQEYPNTKFAKTYHPQ
mmetsp:Transcript_2054/g.2920  ORF Transcript_2054/g.2920 Transcript_2054/m.2920 type:complete len:140 (+) Transcript_2054:23-442(+)